ncbi:hypothetical protein DDE82_006901 [Stemphylium lycopersici]|uniref:Uncharacterized protein n=1 Tax=Stemphylium lycopersici TaxID=183478 RepID=A0A364N122_STELY|nr:hypothetical protein TW65_03423 [Stemphylium lycopersici]RAR00911.1 hypothetical protein DDE82_006901 [Stemphylium lycopersici]RAR08961.1 hypothetical protein DDE83_005719 [Stemphylium lycopersici]
MTTTIGLPYDDLRPHVLRPKKSFFQRINAANDQLLSHMRSLKTEESTSLGRSRAASVVSLTSPPESEREYFQDATKQTEIDYESPMSSGFLSPPISPAEGSFFPIQQFLTPQDRKSSRELLQGMQSYVHWKQATYESNLNQGRPVSPPQTPQSMCSLSSSRSSRSDMSDEEIDDWLEKPMDAEVHRFRALSASSLERPLSAEEAEPKIHVIAEHPDEDDSEYKVPSAMWRETWCWEPETDEYDTEDSTNGIVSLPRQSESKLLALPHEVLQNIAFQAQAEQTRPFRLSCMKLNPDVVAPLNST